ncbi:MAG: FecCD family ABC transporter permease [Phycisphaerales bacterium]
MKTRETFAPGVSVGRAGSSISSRDMAVLISLGVLLIAVSIARIGVGGWYGLDALGRSVLNERLRELGMGLSVGAALAVGGTLLQALLRNPLASPYLLGVSSGAALGVVANQLLMYLHVYVSMRLLGDESAAVIGAIASLLVVYALSQKRGTIDPLGLLLVGVIVNAINGAAIMFINYIVPNGMRGNIALWMMGYLSSSVDWDTLLMVMLITIAAIGVAVWLGRAMDVATFSDAEAHSMGLNLNLLRLGVFGLAGVLTAGSVLLAGPIGFVGLICPHLVRLLLGPRHRLLIVGSAMAGGALVVGAEVVIKLTNVGQGNMPVGVVMAIIGGPVFLWMLRPQLGRGGDA